MSRTRALVVALAGAAAFSLTGCVAVAIPVLAGGAIARSATDGVDAQVTVEPRVSSQASQAALPTPDPAAAEAARDQLARMAAGESSAPQGPALSASATGTLVVRETADPPAPDALGAFALFAARRAGQSPASALAGEGKIASAMLRDPTSLSGERRACAGSTPTVLIDLDPGTALFEPGATMNIPAGASASLQNLRDEGIDIAWISGASAAYAGDIRVALTQAGLDPQGKDRLLLMRYPGDRKQTRREDLADSSCLLAIAGDTRSDFDELFDYLVNPEAALGLELLIGDGWFLIPSLTTPHSLTPSPETGRSSQTALIANGKPKP